MKRWICLILTVVMLMTLCSCGAGKTEETPAQAAGEWTRQGYYSDETGNVLSVTWMDDVVDPGWYVGFMNGEDLIEDSYGGTLQQDGNTLQGKLPGTCFANGKNDGG